MAQTKPPSLFILIICCLLTFSAFGQKLSFEVFTTEDGLSHNYVNSITKDHRGFLWAGTSNGLNRYDGYDFHVYYHHPSDTLSLSHSEITAVFADSRQRLWIGTAKGLNLYDPFQDAFVRQKELAGHAISLIHEDETGTSWVGTDAGLFEYCSGDFHFFQHTAPYHIRSLLFTKKDTLIGTDQGLFKASRNFQDLQKVSSIHEVAYISDMLYFQDKIWVATRVQGIYTLSPEKLDILNHFVDKKENPHGLAANDILSMELSHDNQLWIGTDLGGLHLLDTTGSKFIRYTNDARMENSLSSNNILSIFADENHGLWVGTNFGGLNYVSNKEFFQYYKSNPYHFRSSPVHAIYQDSEKRLWVGSSGDGLTILSEDGKLINAYHSSGEKNFRINGNTIQTIAEDSTGRIWLGFYEHGINIIAPEGSVISSIRAGRNNGLQHDDVRKILQDKQGNIWIATKGGGLHTYNYETREIIPVPLKTEHGDAPDMLIWLYEDPQGKIWLGSNLEKVYYFDPSASTSPIQLIPAPWSILPTAIYALGSNEKNNYWIGTWNSGLYHWNQEDGALKHYGQAEGLTNSRIKAILTDEEAVWVSTSNGLAEYMPQQDSFRMHNKQSGMTYNDFLFSSAHQTTNGTFFFGSNQGFYGFDSSLQLPHNEQNPVYLTGLKVLGREAEIDGGVLKEHIAFSDTVTFSPEHNVFTFEFVSPKFPKAWHQQYTVKLEGFEEEWRNLGNETSATYTNIKPGTYTFRVKVLDENAGNNPKEASIAVIVIPPFWQTPLAYVAYSLALLTIIFFARRFTIARIQLKNDLREEKREREKEEEVHQMKLNFFTGLSHEFRTPLMLILNPLQQILSRKEATEAQQLTLDTKEASMMERNARRLLRLINQLLTFRKLENTEKMLHLQKIDIKPFIQGIYEQFEDMSDRNDIAFSYAVSSEVPVCSFDKEKLETVLFNLLSNAFKFTPPHGKIMIMASVSNIQDTGSHLKIEVADDGIGIPQHLHHYIFDRYYQVDKHHLNGNRGTGIGLALVKKIAELHNGTVSVRSQENKGSCFVVTLPLNLKAKDTYEKEVDFHDKILAPINEIFSQNTEEDIADSTNGKGHTILLVEDNIEVRDYLKSHFVQHYRVYEARNGKEALSLLSGADMEADLIISDVMMPEMDGITLCKQLKSKPETHHIPLILLTAKSGKDSMIQALKAGADDYLEKPVHLDILLIKVKRLLTYREEIRKEISRNLIPEPKTEEFQSAEELFLETAMKVVEENLENPDFSVEEFALAMGVSKTHLYNKLKGITGLSANEFTRSVRLKKAVSLLQQQRWSVSEIAYQVGFNNPNYFSKCFMREYGISPSKFDGHVEEEQD